MLKSMQRLFSHQVSEGSDGYNDHNSVIVSISEAINSCNRFNKVKIVWLDICLVINFLVVYYVR